MGVKIKINSLQIDDVAFQNSNKTSPIPEIKLNTKMNAMKFYRI
jgi:hypothetical protein